MFIRRATFDEMVTALKYAKLQLEYINGRIEYFDATGISKSVTEAAIKKANDVLDKVK